MKVRAGSVTSIDPDYVDIIGLGYHIRIEEVERGVFLVTGLTDHSLSELVIRPSSRNQVLLVEDAGRGTKPVARPHRHLDAHSLDVWLERVHPSMYEHWRDREAHRMDLWEYITDHQHEVWQEFEKWFLVKLLESGGSIV